VISLTESQVESRKVLLISDAPQFYFKLALGKTSFLSYSFTSIKSRRLDKNYTNEKGDGVVQWYLHLDLISIMYLLLRLSMVVYNF
jgi:hypothetical protein